MGRKIDRRTLEAPPELIAAIKRLAKRHQRAVNAEIRVALIAWLEQHGECVLENPSNDPS